MARADTLHKVPFRWTAAATPLSRSSLPAGKKAEAQEARHVDPLLVLIRQKVAGGTGHSDDEVALLRFLCTRGKSDTHHYPLTLHFRFPSKVLRHFHLSLLSQLTADHQQRVGKGCKLFSRS